MCSQTCTNCLSYPLDVLPVTPYLTARLLCLVKPQPHPTMTVTVRHDTVAITCATEVLKREWVYMQGRV